MQRVAVVAVLLEFAPGAGITFSDPLELSLDCPVCRRCRRTVIFREGQAEGKCTPTGHAFPGRIIGKIVGRNGPMASVLYQVEYRYEPFDDAKHPDVEPTGEPKWGRVSFEIACPSCGQPTKTSTQTNIVRPWACQCKCGCVLYTERDEQPVLSSAEAEDAELDRQ